MSSFFQFWRAGASASHSGGFTPKREQVLLGMQGTSQASNSFGRTSSPPMQPSHSSISALASLPETKQLVAQAALNHLFEQKYFSVSTLDKLCDLGGFSRKSAAYLALAPLHCVDYDLMPRALRQQLPHLVNECLQPAGTTPGPATAIALQGVSFTS